MFIVSIDPDTCTGCQECTGGCPAKLLKFNGEKAEVAGDETECLGCESCTTVCLSEAVSVIEV